MRLFCGLSLPGGVRAATAALAKEAETLIPGRYALPENHHITLAFLGEVAPERVCDAKRVLARCIERFPPPRVTLEGFSHFGKPENAILILRASSEPSLFPLNAALKAGLADAGLPCDPGPFSPHVTLARHARMHSAALPAIPPVCFTAPHAHLYLSARDGENVLRYTPLFTAKFTYPGI